MKKLSRKRKDLLAGLAFLGPNILGFLAFTLLPLGFSLALAFSNWDLQLHNMFKDEPIRFVGLEHFRRLLFKEDQFFRFLGNTLFFMIGIPLSILGSLLAAILLGKEMRGGSRRVWAWLIAATALFCSAVLLTLVGGGATAITLLVGGLGCAMLLGGVVGGSTVYRTLFFLPHFTSGVAVYILWKKLYNPHTGPINLALAGPLDSLTGLLRAIPAGWVSAGLPVCLALAAGLLVWVVVGLVRDWGDGEVGTLAALPVAAGLLLPMVMAIRWLPAKWPPTVVLALVVVAGLVALAPAVRGGRPFACDLWRSFGTYAMVSLGVGTLCFVLIGIGLVFHHLPGWAADGLAPPDWLGSYHWAKPAIMIMGLWGAIGSNNMLLYLAGLSNVPPELVEAADIDGASRFQRFWHVTWPQLAPVTFFIVVMSVIGGLQGGFEMARTMTRGGPAGATTTLSYFIYTEGFETGRLGYASAVAWALFVLVFVVTLFNWKFGSRYVND